MMTIFCRKWCNNVYRGLAGVVAVLAAAIQVQGTELVDRIIAVVNDDVITLQELNQSYQPVAFQIQSKAYSEAREQQLLFKAREDLINRLIDKKLTDQEVMRAGIEISSKEIDNAIERIKSANFYTDEQLRKALQNDGRSMEDLRRHLEEQLLRRRLIDLKVKSKIVITQEDIQAYYEHHPEAFAGKNLYHLRNILMVVPPSYDTAAKQKVYSRMNDILSMLEEGQSFQTLARQFSESPMADEGGDLGSFELEKLSPQLREALVGRQAGEFTAVLDTEQGYQIFYIEEITRKADKTLEDATAEIEIKLYNQVVNEKFNAWLSELRKRSYLKIIQ